METSAILKHASNILRVKTTGHLIYPATHAHGYTLPTRTGAAVQQALLRRVSARSSEARQVQG